MEKRFIRITVLLAAFTAILLIAVPLLEAAQTTGTVQAPQEEQQISAPLLPEQTSPSEQPKQTSPSSPSSAQVIPIDSGLPPVSSQDAVEKVNTITNRVYSMAANVAPMMSVIIIIAAAALGMLIKKAMYQIIWVALGLIIILWAPFLVSLIVGLIQ